MGGASYLNPYPIMEDDFCETIGVANGSLNCSNIDFDSLPLGGCWCHPCLPENPCLNNGTCVNYMRRGYTCDCNGTNRTGDHCQTPATPVLTSAPTQALTSVPTAALTPAPTSSSTQ